MYTREESTRIRQEFWTTLGQYMAPQLSADGLRINWVNYKTGVPGISFRMDATGNTAIIAIVLSQPDKGIQELYYEQFMQMKRLFEDQLQEEWIWHPLTADQYGKTISSIYKELPNINVMRREDWPGIISFFKPRMIALDEFWSAAKYTFDELRF